MLVAEDENGEAEAEVPDPAAQGNFGDHNHPNTAGPFPEVVVAGEVYGIGEVGYAVGHKSMPNVDAVEVEEAVH